MAGPMTRACGQGHGVERVGRQVPPSGRGGGVRALRLLAVACVFVLPMAVTLELKHMGERGVLSERELQQVATELQVQDGLEWRAISGRVRPQAVVEDLAASRDRAVLLLDNPRRGGLDTADARRLEGLHGEYGQVVDQQLRLLQAGQLEEAADFDEQQVDPAFERAHEALAEVAGQVSARADRARVLSDAGVLPPGQHRRPPCRRRRPHRALSDSTTSAAAPLPGLSPLARSGSAHLRAA